MGLRRLPPQAPYGARSGGGKRRFGVGGIHAIPVMAPHWKKLDLAEILSRPAAYMSVSQNKSLFNSWGAQAAEKHSER